MCLYNRREISLRSNYDFDRSHLIRFNRILEIFSYMSLSLKSLDDTDWTELVETDRNYSDESILLCIMNGGFHGPNNKFKVRKSNKINDISTFRPFSWIFFKEVRRARNWAFQLNQSQKPSIKKTHPPKLWDENFVAKRVTETVTRRRYSPSGWVLTCLSYWRRRFVMPWIFQQAITLKTFRHVLEKSRVETEKGLDKPTFKV